MTLAKFIETLQINPIELIKEKEFYSIMLVPGEISLMAYFSGHTKYVPVEFTERLKYNTNTNFVECNDVYNNMNIRIVLT